jgi:hypothetical protein
MPYIVIEAKTANAHQRIQDWRRANQGGFLINYRGPGNAILHRSLCGSHLGDTEWQAGRKNWGSLGSNTKVLSARREELVQWAKEKQAKLKPCRSCQP